MHFQIQFASILLKSFASCSLEILLQNSFTLSSLVLVTDTGFVKRIGNLPSFSIFRNTGMSSSLKVLIEFKMLNPSCHGLILVGRFFFYSCFFFIRCHGSVQIVYFITIVCCGVCSLAVGYHSPLAMCRVPPSTINTSPQRQQLQLLTSLTSPSSTKHLSFVFSNGDLPSFVESNKQPWQQPELLGGFHGDGLDNQAIRCNPFVAWEVFRWPEMWSCDIVSPSLGNSIQIYFIHVYVLRGLYNSSLLYGF